MKLATRRVHFAGLTPNPDEGWILQAARDLTDAEAGFLRGTKYLLVDRDAKFSQAFRVTLEQGGVEAVRLPPRSPSLSPHIERFMRSVQDKFLHRPVLFGEATLLSAVREFVLHFHAGYSRRGLGNRVIQPGDETHRTTGDIVCRERLGGLLRNYNREAA